MKVFKSLGRFDAQKYHENDEFRSALSHVFFLSDRKYEFTQMEFFLDKNFPDKKFVKLKMIVENQYDYGATLKSPYEYDSWSYLPNSAG